jgi:hypothetical protein
MHAMLGRLRAMLGVAVLSIVSSGCGVIGPTPFVHQPPLPQPEPYPDLMVEALVASLEAEGLRCAFTPDSDIPGGWGCELELDGPWSARVSFTPEDGNVVTLGAQVGYFQDGPDPAADPPDPGEFDALAATVFHQLVIIQVFGDEEGPTIDELTAAVHDNTPKVIREEWLLHFGRNSILRTIGVIYREP